MGWAGGRLGPARRLSRSRRQASPGCSSFQLLTCPRKTDTLKALSPPVTALSFSSPAARSWLSTVVACRSCLDNCFELAIGLSCGLGGWSSSPLSTVGSSFRLSALHPSSETREHGELWWWQHQWETEVPRYSRPSSSFCSCVLSFPLACSVPSPTFLYLSSQPDGLSSLHHTLYTSLLCICCCHWTLLCFTHHYCYQKRIPASELNSRHIEAVPFYLSTGGILRGLRTCLSPCPPDVELAHPRIQPFIIFVHIVFSIHTLLYDRLNLVYGFGAIPPSLL